jgi:hypothetical protein
MIAQRQRGFIVAIGSAQLEQFMRRRPSLAYNMESR